MSVQKNVSRGTSDSYAAPHRSEPFLRELVCEVQTSQAGRRQGTGAVSTYPLNQATMKHIKNQRCALQIVADPSDA